MSDVLFIKTSSLGDVIHHMPALTEAKARRPGARFGWVVEEAFAPLVRLHPAVDVVVPVGLRRWRRAFFRPSTWTELARFRHDLRDRAYDEVIDTQGLVKSALLAWMAHGRRHGYDAQSIKEPAACRFYQVRHAVAWNQHAVARNRALTGHALGYEPRGEADYGLQRMRLADTWATPYGVLLHATAHRGKEWGEANWLALTAAVGGDIELVVPAGTESERARALRIAAGSARARVPDRQPLDAMARLIAGASFVVGVDTGLSHLAAALGVPLVAIFADSEPGLTGPVGPGPIAVLGAKGAPPSLDAVIEAVARIRR